MTTIEESRAKRFQAQAFLAQAYEEMDPSKENSPEVPSNQEYKKRKLKVD